MEKPDILLISLMNWCLSESFIQRFDIRDMDVYKQLTGIVGAVPIATDLARTSQAPVKYLRAIFRNLLEQRPFASQNIRTALLLSLWVHRQLGQRMGQDQIEAVVRTLKYRNSTTEQKLSMLMTGLSI